MYSLAIIIPCYNEAQRLDKEAFISFATLKPSTLLLFINDGSTDCTGDVLHSLKCSAPGNIQILTNHKNVGKGESIRTAIHYCIETNISFAGYVDADLSTSLVEIDRLFAIALKSNADMILGSRIKKIDTVIIRSGFRHLMGRFIATIIDTRFKLGCYDTQCGAKVLNVDHFKEIIQSPFYTRWFFDVELILRYRKKYGVSQALEVPLNKWINKKGSKMNILKTGLVLKEIFYLFTKYK